MIAARSPNMEMPEPWRRGAYSGAASPRDRARAIGLTLAILALIVWTLVQLGYTPLAPARPSEHLTAFDLAAAGSRAPEKSKSVEAAQPAARRSLPLPLPPVIKPPVALPAAPVPRTTPSASPFIALSEGDMASSDIGKMARGGGAGTGNSSATYGPGEGPSGQRLYRAEWYREPSNAEIAGYMPALSQQPEWAEIACKTIEHYHVENCQALGESPAGSGLARALRQAAWQFLVRPPRIDGKPQVGARVRIHFDFVHGEAR